MIASNQTDTGHRRLPPARSFAEATALVEAALGQLRDAEEALERQLRTLSHYIDTSRAAGGRSGSAAH